MNVWAFHLPILIIASASADASGDESVVVYYLGDESAAKYSEMSAILGILGHIWPANPSL